MDERITFIKRVGRSIVSGLLLLALFWLLKFAALNYYSGWPFFPPEKAEAWLGATYGWNICSDFDQSDGGFTQAQVFSGNWAYRIYSDLAKPLGTDTYLCTSELPATSGLPYSISSEVLGSAVNFGWKFRVEIVFENSTHNTLSLAYYDLNGTSAPLWTDIAYNNAVSPANTAYVIFRIGIIARTSSAGANQYMYFDDVVACQCSNVSEGNEYLSNPGFEFFESPTPTPTITPLPPCIYDCFGRAFLTPLDLLRNADEFTQIISWIFSTLLITGFVGYFAGNEKELIAGGTFSFISYGWLFFGFFTVVTSIIIGLLATAVLFVTIANAN